MEAAVEVALRHASVLILAASLDPQSRSFRMAKEMQRILLDRDVTASLIDLREVPVPLSDGFNTVPTEAVLDLRQAVRQATHLVFAVPVYNWDVNAAAKNVVEWMTGEDLNDKTVAFLCAAGGQSSYMSVMSFANSLMLDFRCWIVPRFVYAVGSDFADGELANPEIRKRIVGLCDEMFSHLPVALLRGAER